MRASLRKGMLFGALAGVVALIAFGPEGEDVARELPEPSAASVAARGKTADNLRLPDRQGLRKPRGDLFAAPPAPKPAATVVAPAAPVAPALPYRFAGIVRQGGETQVLIAKGDLVFPIKEGETLDGAYRVASIAADRIELVYVPLGTTERIAVSSALDVGPPPRAPVANAPRQAPAPAAASSESATLRWEGPQRVRAGSSVRVALRVSYDRPLRAAPMQLRFEPGVVEALSVRPGKFLGQGNFSYRVNAEGSIFVGASAAGSVPGADAELLIVTFRPMKVGATAALSMAALSLQGAAGGTVAYAQFADYRAAIHP